jgi:hypothetical protein
VGGGTEASFARLFVGVSTRIVLAKCHWGLASEDACDENAIFNAAEW